MDVNKQKHVASTKQACDNVSVETASFAMKAIAWEVSYLSVPYDNIFPPFHPTIIFNTLKHSESDFALPLCDVHRTSCS